MCTMIVSRAASTHGQEVYLSPSLWYKAFTPICIDKIEPETELGLLLHDIGGAINMSQQRRNYVP